ncbi:MAG: sensor histidine kinase [Pseudomonadota bacterium]
MTTELRLKPAERSPRPFLPPASGCQSCQEQVRIEERKHLARELHDSLGSLLMIAKLDVASIRSELTPVSPSASRRLHHLVEVLNQAMALKSRIMDGLEPPLLSSQGLVKTVAKLAQDFSSASGIVVTTRLEDVVLPASVQLAVYRLIEEALTNMGKYASASRSSITLTCTDDGVQVAVEDDGVGFRADTDNTMGHGLVGMRHRIEACGGALVVESAPGCGTRLLARLPR